MPLSANNTLMKNLEDKLMENYEITKDISRGHILHWALKEKFHKIVNRDYSAIRQFI